MNEEIKEREIKKVSFLKNVTGKLKRTNDYSGIGAAVRSMVEGRALKLDFPSNDYLTREEDDTDNT